VRILNPDEGLAPRSGILGHQAAKTGLQILVQLLHPAIVLGVLSRRQVGRRTPSRTEKQTGDCGPRPQLQGNHGDGKHEIVQPLPCPWQVIEVDHLREPVHHHGHYEIVKTSFVLSYLLTRKVLCSRWRR